MNPSAKHAVISLLLLVANAPMSLSTSSDSQSSNPPVAPDPDFLGSPLFSAWTDPASGVISHLLAPSGTEAGRARIAPLQQTFYYINNGLFSAPGGSRLLWFYCAFPPAQVRTLAVADFDAGTMRKFPDAGLGGAGTNPAMLHPVTGEVCWSNTQGIWRRSPSPGTRPVLVNAFDPKFINNRSLIQYATHLTLSADGGAFAIDARIGGRTYIGQAPLDGSKIEVWHSEARLYNHAQFNPRHPGLILLAQENYTNPETGEVRYKDNRLWLARRPDSGAAGRPVFYPVYPQSLARFAGPDYHPVTSNPHLAVAHAEARSEPRQMHGHEWWSADGEYIYYIHYQTGIERTPLATAGTPEAAPELLWPSKTVSHAHSSPDGRFLVFDSAGAAPYGVTFVNLVTRRSLDIVSRMPAPPAELRPYHLHPHPSFCGPRGEYICYTMIRPGGEADVAFVRVSDLVVATMP